MGELSKEEEYAKKMYAYIKLDCDHEDFDINKVVGTLYAYYIADHFLQEDDRK